jgi:hypothetical protein
MDISIPFWLIVIVGIVVLLFLGSLLTGFFWFLFQAGVAINESRKPPHTDAGDYRLDQGHEVRFEDREKDRGERRA